ncbi:hypothetical protein [Limnohabitans sp. 2KL-3]|uniref:hypothetical protein n=1 Tax=Limnohabitans sp. 2KL-3 TaxID=1100700 RepID=UPI000B05EDBE|nr:hypothetical protein [Limnohabitans sp. 2KL-3]
MVTLVKHEWHQVDSQFAFEITPEILSEIYPDLDEDELTAKLSSIESGEVTIEELLEAANQNNVDFDWERQNDDFWTERKGGYDVSYELGDESSWKHEPAPPLPNRKCSHCRWEGQKYSARYVGFDQDGKVVDDESAIEPTVIKTLCPMCDSSLLSINHTRKCISCEWMGDDSEVEDVWSKDEDERHREEGEYCPLCASRVEEVIPTTEDIEQAIADLQKLF